MRFLNFFLLLECFLCSNERLGLSFSTLERIFEETNDFIGTSNEKFKQRFVGKKSKPHLFRMKIDCLENIGEIVNWPNCKIWLCVKQLRAKKSAFEKISFKIAKNEIFELFFNLGMLPLGWWTFKPDGHLNQMDHLNAS